jgi:hypothetical protein
MARYAAKHRKEGTGNFTDCMRCHSNGREEIVATGIPIDKSIVNQSYNSSI